MILGTAPLPSAGPLQRALAWRSSLAADAGGSSDLELVLGLRRDATIDDGRWLDDTISKLARAMVLPAEVPSRCTAVTVQGDDERWMALDRVRNRYEQLLAEAGLCDPRLTELRRLRAQAQVASDAPHAIAMVGVLELDRTARVALDIFGKATAGRQSAPKSDGASEALPGKRGVLVISAADVAGLDEYGTVSPDRHPRELADQHVVMSDTQLAWLGGPAESAAYAIDIIAEWHANQHVRTSQDVVICSPDTTFTAELCLAAAGVSGFAIHDAAGVSLSATGIGRLVQAIAAYVRRRDRLSLATLVKHGDVQRVISARAGERLTQQWPRLIDAEATESPRSFVDPGQQGGSGTCHSVAGVLHGFANLGDAGDKPLRDQVVRLGRVLGALLGDELEKETTKALAAAINEVGACDAVMPGLVSLAETCDLLVEALSTTMRVADGVGGAVDVLGWLDAAYDPAPNLVLLGLNSGIMPARSAGDPWLNETVLRALGMFTAEHAAARDAYLLRHMLETRLDNGRVCAIIAASDADGAPLWPSPFVFAADDAAALRRAKRMISGERTVASVRAERPASARKVDADAFPTAPVAVQQAVQAISVTAFKDYIASPYVFYVRHALRLKEAGEPDRETGYDRLGTLTHELLRDFAASRLSNSENAEQIEAWLLEQFEQRAVAWPKGLVESTAMLQQAVLKRRLTTFAALQAKQRRDGWQISKTEWDPPKPVILRTARGDVQLKGRIDRIDRRGGEVMVLDYKTSDRKKRPSDAYKKGRKDEIGQWKDLQLPLYRYMLMKSEFDTGGPVSQSTSWSLGYWPLCKDRDGPEIVTLPVGIDELEAAEKKAIEIVESVLSGAFDELGDPKDYGGSISRLCGLRLLDADDEESGA